MRVSLTLYINDRQQLQPIIDDIQEYAKEKKTFQIDSANTSSQVGMAEAEILLSLALNFTGSIAAEAAIYAAQSLANYIRHRHNVVSGAEAVPQTHSSSSSSSKKEGQQSK